MISRAAAEDLDEILTVQKQVFAKVAQEIHNTNIPPLTQTAEEIQAEHLNRVFLKYVLDGKIVGSVRAHVDADRFCQIGRLFVLPEYQGQGLGKALMCRIEQEFTACSGYELFTDEDNAAVVSFYKQLGYTPYLSKVRDGVPMVYMRKVNRPEQH